MFVCDIINIWKYRWRLWTKQILITSVTACSAWPSPAEVFQQQVFWKRMIPAFAFSAIYEMYRYLSEVRGFLMLLQWVQVRMWEGEEITEIMTSSSSKTYLSLLWRVQGKEKVSSTVRVFGRNFRIGSPFHYRNYHLRSFWCSKKTEVFLKNVSQIDKWRAVHHWQVF